MLPNKKVVLAVGFLAAIACNSQGTVDPSFLDALRPRDAIRIGSALVGMGLTTYDCDFVPGISCSVLHEFEVEPGVFVEEPFHLVPEDHVVDELPIAGSFQGLAYNQCWTEPYPPDIEFHFIEVLPIDCSYRLSYSLSSRTYEVELGKFMIYLDGGHPLVFEHEDGFPMVGTLASATCFPTGQTAQSIYGPTVSAPPGFRIYPVGGDAFPDPVGLAEACFESQPYQIQGTIRYFSFQALDNVDPGEQSRWVGPIVCQYNFSVTRGSHGDVEDFSGSFCGISASWSR